MFHCCQHKSVSQGSITEGVTIATQEVVTKAVDNDRKYRSPNRILARSFRLARDKWKQRYMDTRAALKRSRQLATERGDSRDRWRAECNAALEQARAAEALAQERLQELEQLRARELEVKKLSSPTLADGLDADSPTPARGSTPLAIIEVWQRLVVQAGVAMRAVPRVFMILYRKLEATTVIPAASSVRWRQ